VEDKKQIDGQHKIRLWFRLNLVQG